MEGLSPRAGPSSSGSSGPSGAVITGEQPDNKITDHFSAAQLDQLDRHPSAREGKNAKKKAQRRKGKEIADEELRPEPAKTVPYPGTNLVRDISKVRLYERELPAPDISYPSKPSGLRSSKRDPRRWDAPSASVPSGSGRKASDPIVIPGLRPGRSVSGEPAPERASMQEPSESRGVRDEGRKLPDEHPTIRVGESDQYGTAPNVEDEVEDIDSDDDEGKLDREARDWFAAMLNEMGQPLPPGHHDMSDFEFCCAVMRETTWDPRQLVKMSTRLYHHCFPGEHLRWMIDWLANKKPR